jgi:hypothetical protein
MQFREQDIYMKNNDTSETWAWTKETIFKYNQKPYFIERYIFIFILKAYWFVLWNLSKSTWGSLFNQQWHQFI